MKKQVFSFIIVLLLLLGAVNLGPSYAITDKLEEFEGTYRGWYYATQGHTGLTLKIYKNSSNEYEATFNFYSVPENSRVPSGEYLCDVYYNESNDSFYIEGKEWTDRPSGYSFVDLDGELDSTTYIGEVIASSRRYNFELYKQIDENETSTWAEDTIDEAIINSFVPIELQSKYKEPITRSEFTRLAVAAISLKSNTDIKNFIKSKNLTVQSKPFTDTINEFVNYASTLNIANGYGNGKFGPDDLITREQSAVMLKNLADTFDVSSSNYILPDFNDKDLFSNWALEGIKFITNHTKPNSTKAVMVGYNNNFDPKGNYTREQAIITIYNLIESLK